MNPVLTFLVGVLVAVGAFAAWFCDYRDVTKKRSYDWSSDLPWPSLVFVTAIGLLWYLF